MIIEWSTRIKSEFTKVTFPGKGVNQEVNCNILKDTDCRLSDEFGRKTRKERKPNNKGWPTVMITIKMLITADRTRN